MRIGDQNITREDMPTMQAWKLNPDHLRQSIQDVLNNKLQTHPDVVLVKQKISAEEELRNAKIDEKNKQYEELKKCNG